MLQNNPTVSTDTQEVDYDEDIDREISPATRYEARYIIFRLRRKITWLVATCMILFVTLCVFIYLWKESENSSTKNSKRIEFSTTSNSDICTTHACIELADQYLSSIDTSIDPCDDFYLYSCGNWIKQHNYQLTTRSQYSQFTQTSIMIDNQVLDALIHDINQSIVNHSSVLKAKQFYDSCRYNYLMPEKVDASSESLTETFEITNIFKKFVEIVNFTGNFDFDGFDRHNNTDVGWYDTVSLIADDDEVKKYFVYEKFIDVFVWLGQRGWNCMLQFEYFNGTTPQLLQNYDIWLNYDSNMFAKMVNVTFIPYYQRYFGLTLDNANLMAQKVIQFSNNLHNATTVSSVYLDITELITKRGFYSLDKLEYEDKVAQSKVLNFTKIIFDTYEITSIDEYDYININKIEIGLLEPFFQYWGNLKLLIESSEPIVVQYYLFTQVLLYIFDYNGYIEQFQQISRSEYCLNQLKNYFPYVYSYMVNKVVFNQQIQDQVMNMTNDIINQLETMLNQSLWLKNCTTAGIDSNPTTTSTTTTSRARDPQTTGTYTFTEWQEIYCAGMNNTLTKLRSMKGYVGAPDMIGDYAKLDVYYRKLYISVTKNLASSSQNYWSNLYYIGEFNKYNIINGWKGNVYNIAKGWIDFFPIASISLESNVFYSYVCYIYIFFYVQLLYFELTSLLMI